MKLTTTIAIAAVTFVAGTSFAMADQTSAKVTQLLNTDKTITGQTIELPKHAFVNVSTYEIEPGAELPVHTHPYQRYGYVISGDVEVTNVDTGKVEKFSKGDFIVEAVNERHKGKNTGKDLLVILVIDQTPDGGKNVRLAK